MHGWVHPRRAGICCGAGTWHAAATPHDVYYKDGSEGAAPAVKELPHVRSEGAGSLHVVGFTAMLQGVFSSWVKRAWRARAGGWDLFCGGGSGCIAGALVPPRCSFVCCIPAGCLLPLMQG